MVFGYVPKEPGEISMNIGIGGGMTVIKDCAKTRRDSARKLL